VLAVNAVLALRRVGLAEDVLAVGAELVHSEIQDRGGETIQAVRLDELFEEAGLPTLAFHRAELHEALLRPGRRRVPPPRAHRPLEPSRGVLAARPSPARASARLAADRVRSLLIDADALGDASRAT
jgi:hypothetical protein